MTRFFLLMFALAAVSTAKDDVASLIIKMERAALDHSDRGDLAGSLEICAPEITYFDPFIEKPIRGLEALRAHYAGIPPENGKGEMSNTHVQVAGDTAVLTYNYVYRYANGAKVNHWNATEVYKKTKDGWRIIHSHWSFIKPELAK